MNDFVQGLIGVVFVFFAFALVVKVCYIDVFGHWPKWREIWDYHDTDKDDEK